MGIEIVVDTVVTVVVCHDVGLEEWFECSR